MSQKRDLGPILAIAGGALALGAVVAGFIIIGGPCDARDRRLDDITMRRVTTTLNLVHCAYDETGAAPRTLENVVDIAVHDSKDREIDWSTCALGLDVQDIRDLTSPSITTAGAVTYEPMSSTRIRICANFRRPSRASDGTNCYDRLGYAAFEEPRRAGAHCYDVELIKGRSETPPCNAARARAPIY